MKFDASTKTLTIITLMGGLIGFLAGLVLSLVAPEFSDKAPLVIGLVAGCFIGTALPMLRRHNKSSGERS